MPLTPQTLILDSLHWPVGAPCDPNDQAAAEPGPRCRADSWPQGTELLLTSASTSTCSCRHLHVSVHVHDYVSVYVVM